MIQKIEQIVTTVQSRPTKRLVVAVAQDAHTLEAVSEAVELGVVEAILVGERAAIEATCTKIGADPARFTIIDEADELLAIERSVRMVRNGEADLLMKGLTSTDKYMRAILNKEYGLLPPKGILSHMTIFEIPGYHKLVCVSDVAIIPHPDLQQKIALIKYLTQTARSLGVERPKVAVLAPSEQLLPGVPSSTEAAVLTKMADRGQLGDMILDGPLALDVAISAEVAATKKLCSPVAGDADCLLMPSLDAGNIFFKALNQFCKAPLAAMVVGTTAPCVLTSRGDSAKSKLYSIALAALNA